MNYIEEISNAFEHYFGASADLFVQSPGRKNLIGEHVDYNDGIVLPEAFDKFASIAIRKRSDQFCIKMLTFFFYSTHTCIFYYQNISLNKYPKNY